MSYGCGGFFRRFFFFFLFSSGDDNAADTDPCTEGEELSSPDGCGVEEFMSNWLESWDSQDLYEMQHQDKAISRGITLKDNRQRSPRQQLLAEEVIMYSVQPVAMLRSDRGYYVQQIEAQVSDGRKAPIGGTTNP